ncbi:DNA polymerase IV [Thioclava sp. F36-7]|uniref:DNA polymerase IV n=1 Tax=Thioclava sp. F36-7 TaxID=1915317 RepID=UPI000998ADE8|nr:DNA polymerase IV [Thioclava sp. F36-7]OOY09266.1 DNA polymerase IV [Thioclava sp. F36-7]
MPALCRHCLKSFDEAPKRCPACGKARIVAHPELFDLPIAHIDCDSFYASVEKRDNPELSSQAVIVGGGTRGVVTTCCYIARISGVRSAMPMFQARKLCPDAVIVKPRMEHYANVSREIRAKMVELTPLIEPLSLDEAFLDLGGTERLHHAPPALLMARLAREIETEIGVTASVGLSHNKFLAKIASDLDKPRGFSVIGRGDTEEFLRDKPVSILWGVGAATRSALGRAGIRTLADIRRAGLSRMEDRFGASGRRLFELASGLDARRVSPDSPMKSVSNETTFNTDIADREALMGKLWHLAEKVSARMKARDLAGRTVTLKLKKADFATVTRQTRLEEPSQLADTLYRAGETLFDKLPKGQAYRLIGIGFSDLTAADGRDPAGDLLDPDAGKRASAERAKDAIRARFGADAIRNGRGWDGE